MEQLFSREVVSMRIKEMGRELSSFYAGRQLTVIVLMNGGAFFACDLVREMNIPLWFDSLRASSYIHDRREGKVTLTETLKLPVTGRHILLADDVFDSGETVRTCRQYLLEAGAVSVKSAVLVNKKLPGRTCEPDWAGFEAPDRYLVGFGLDSEEFHRNLPFIGAMN
ncbi:MAG: hypoxanthine phosphoribosyltransferase [Lentisphaerae bacterium]|nr:hypoxanthine phosphoribosyltransferase [Lentisphaerota bacterium]